MEGQVSGPGWLVTRYTGRFWRAVKTRQSHLGAGHDRKNAAMSNMAFCVWRGLRGAVIDCADVGHGSDGSLRG